MKLRTCVTAAGTFEYGIHRPRFTADNLRETDGLADLGKFADGSRHRNAANFPAGPIHEPAADWIFEIPNPFPFRGTTYIGKAWADTRADKPESIALPTAPAISFSGGQPNLQAVSRAIGKLARPLQLALAVSSTDVRDLCCLAHVACTFCVSREDGTPWGLAYARRPDGNIEAVIADEALFEAVANNPHLPVAYKQAMVLRPGAQGNSEIVGEWSDPDSHVFEYLRRNSYIPWGHYAANMADDAVRYHLEDLGLRDMVAMRHLYYQRSYARLGGLLGLPSIAGGSRLADGELERLRHRIRKRLKNIDHIDFDRTLWGWNFGFDYAPSGYRLHASHQQIHQQFALVPSTVPCATDKGELKAYACGDLVGDLVSAFRRETGKGFFECYQQAIANNQRMDGNSRGERRLVVFEDERVMVFVPKAQTSQWELQLMPKTSVGHIVEADTAMRRSLDRAILTAVKVLGAMGARLISTIEYSKSIVDDRDDQRLLMAFLPKLPESPGAFSEAQLRWINGHYPEDFALACRRRLDDDAKCQRGPQSE